MPSSSSPAHAHRAGVLQVCSAGVLWGTAPIALDLIHHRTPLTAVAASAYRLAIATVVLVIVTAAAGHLRTLFTTVRTAPVALVAIGLGVASYQGLWFAAIVHVGASVATVLSLGLAPVLVTGWESWRARRRPAPRQIATVATAVIGLALVSASSGHAGLAATDPAAGLLLATASGILYAATTVLSRHVAPTVPPLALTTATTAAGALVLLPVAVLVGPALTTDGGALAALGYLGVVTMAGAYLLWYAGLRTASGSTATVATLLEPATAAILARLLLGEVLPLPGIIGIVLILTAVAALRGTGGRQPGG